MSESAGLWDVIASIANKMRGGDASESEQINALMMLSVGIDGLILNNPLSPRFSDLHPPWRECTGSSSYASYEYATLLRGRLYHISMGPGMQAWGAITIYAGDTQDNLAIESSHQFSDFKRNHDGSFVVSVGGAGGNDDNWIDVSEGATAVIVRQYFETKDQSKKSNLTIAIVDGGSNDGGQLNSGLVSDGVKMQNLGYFLASWLQVIPMPEPMTKSECNKDMHPFVMAGSGVRWTSPHNTHAFGYFMLDGQETLSLRVPVSECVLWSCELWHPTMALLIVGANPSGISSSEVVYEPDGSCIIQVSNGQPENHKNHLNTGGVKYGIVYFRWIEPKSPPGSVVAEVLGGSM